WRGAWAEGQGHTPANRSRITPSARENRALAGLPACGFRVSPTVGPPSRHSPVAWATFPVTVAGAAAFRRDACRIPSWPVIGQEPARPQLRRAPLSCQAGGAQSMTDSHDITPPITAEEQARHAAKMAKIKAARDRMMQGKTGEKGLIIVHTGPGK